MLTCIPIFITARGNNDMTIKKNKCALKFSYIFIESMGLFDQTYIISENKDMLDYAKRLGFKYTIYHPVSNNEELKYLEYISTYNFGLQNNYWPDWIILLSIDELFINENVIKECIRNIDDKYDVVTSYTEISNRSHFFLNESNVLDRNIHRITNDKDRQKMADATIYAIKSSFARECMTTEDPATHFWNGKFKFFKNSSLYTDIYESKDIDKFLYIREILDKVDNLKIED